MFRGKVQNSIDGKNRVIIPAKYRDALGKECIVTKGLDDCLEVYPMQAWADEEARYATLPRTDVEARALLRYRSGNAENCELDKQGRMVIPQFLREEAGSSYLWQNPQFLGLHAGTKCFRVQRGQLGGSGGC